MRKISSIIIVFLVLSTMGTILGASDGLHSGESIIDEFLTSPEEHTIDVPTWQIGTTWTYDQSYWSNDTDPDAILQVMHVEERMTYTVSSIEFVNVNGVSTPVYNVTMEGDVLSGSGIAAPQAFDVVLHFTVDRGTSGGYFLYRMDDLSLLVDHQYKSMDMSLRDFDLDMETYVQLTDKHDPGLDSYDYPLSPGRHFWANNTIDVNGYSNVKVGPFDETRYLENILNLDRRFSVSEETVTHTAPAGTFDGIHMITEEISGDDQGERVRHYSSEVQNYIRETQNLDVVDWHRVLVSYYVPDNENSLTLDPPVGYPGQTVTVNGSFPNNPSSEFTLNMPMAGIHRSVETDASGFFTAEIEIPNVPDNTDTFGLVGSHGVIAYLTSDISSDYQIATLSILHPEGLFRPSNPRPINGAINIGLSPMLEVYVENVGGLPMDVTFYDASTHRSIGVAENVESGTFASVQWMAREMETTYSWYAEVEDEMVSRISDTWSFTTGHGGEYFDLYIEVEGQGTTDPVPGIHPRDEGTEITITAIPNDGWYFSEWVGDYNGTDEEITIGIYRDLSITAVFREQASYNVRILEPGPGDRFEEGDLIEIVYNVTNRGDNAGITDILFRVGEDDVDSIGDVSLQPGESYEGIFTWEAGESGSYRFEIICDDGSSDSVSVWVDPPPSLLMGILLGVGIWILGNCLLFIVLLIVVFAVLAYYLIHRRKKKADLRRTQMEHDERLKAVHLNRKNLEHLFMVLQEKFLEADKLDVECTEEKDMFVDIKFRYHQMNVDESSADSLNKARSDLIFLRSFLSELTATVNLKLDEELKNIMEHEAQEINDLIMKMEENIEKASAKGLDVTEMEEELEQVRAGVREILEGDTKEVEVEE